MACNHNLILVRHSESLAARHRVDGTPCWCGAWMTCRLCGALLMAMPFPLPEGTEHVVPRAIPVLVMQEAA